MALKYGLSMNMRLLTTTLFLLLYTNTTLALEGVILTKKDGEKLEGQLIETYIDRWFYEPPREDDDKYYLVFNSGELTLVNKKDVLQKERIEIPDNKFESYLIDMGLIIDQPLVEGATVLTAHEGHHKFEEMFGNFAWDLGILGCDQRQFRSQGKELEDYYIYGAEVFSPVKGKVVGGLMDRPDNRPSADFSSDISGLESNYLLIEVEHPFYFSIVHFKENSIIPKIGDWIETGDLLGEVGNSGASYIPHLHFTLYFYAKNYDRFISIPMPTTVYPNSVH